MSTVWDVDTTGPFKTAHLVKADSTDYCCSDAHKSRIYAQYLDAMFTGLERVLCFKRNPVFFGEGVCSLPGWCSAMPGRGSAGCTQTLFLEKMISPSRPERSEAPPAAGLKVRRSEALEEARRRSRPRDISYGAGTLGPSSGEQKKQ